MILTEADREQFWETVVPAFGLDASYRYSDSNIADYLAAYDVEGAARARGVGAAHLLSIIDRLDAVEADERSVMDDDGIAALIELSDARDDIRALALAASPVQWHLFLISDGSGHPVLISAESESALKAEELATAAVLDEWDLDPEFLNVEYVGVIDRDVHKRF